MTWNKKKHQKQVSVMKFMTTLVCMYNCYKFFNMYNNAHF